MGAQINFYMTQEDEENFVRYLMSQQGVQILKDWTPTPQPLVLTELPGRETLCWFSVWLWNARISPLPELHFVKQQGHYCLDPMPYEVVEFHRSAFDNSRLVRGRLWAEFNGWSRENPAVIIRKSDAFRKWYHQLAGWIRRHSAGRAKSAYLMPGASDFVRNGGRIVQAVFADGTTFEG